MRIIRRKKENENAKAFVTKMKPNEWITVGPDVRINVKQDSGLKSKLTILAPETVLIKKDNYL